MIAKKNGVIIPFSFSAASKYLDGSYIITDDDGNVINDPESYIASEEEKYKNSHIDGDSKKDFELYFLELCEKYGIATNQKG